MSGRLTDERLEATLIEFADAVDKDRGFPTGLTESMRGAAAELMRLRQRETDLREALRDAMDALAVLRFPNPSVQAPGEADALADAALAQSRVALGEVS